MLRKLRYVPKEHLIQKFSDLTGMSYDAAERLAEREGIEVVSDYVEAYLSMPTRQFHNQRSYARKY
ncbi:MAG: PASTA domain-containing protein [bacterium]